MGQGTSQSIRICALRVEFQPDQNELTTGNGLFMVDSVTTDPYAIDPAPHNRLYFQDQIRAAANYYSKVSQGNLSISGDVFPSAEKAAFRLPREMGAYNPNTSSDQINEGLANLFKDAIEAAKKGADSIDFSQYDLVVVFHAGVGKDIDVGYDPTPQDISSLYVTSKFLQSIFGTAFPGVDVGNGQYVDHGIILPETLNQEGYALALTGMFVSNIGSYLGLYDLFSPSKQRTGVGRFGLMDVGLMNLNGLIPSPPGAYSRFKLGWDQPLVLTHPQNSVGLKRLGSDEPSAFPTLVKVPINEDEYYLLENRGDASVNLDSLYDELLTDRDDVPTYLELLKTKFGDQIEIGQSGVLLSVPDYDWGLPGAGILIWHVDDRLIRERSATGAINDDPDLRAVDIEEADGSEDIGQSYTLLDAGFQKELGWFADFWFSNRPEGLDGYELYKNEFSSASTPATRSNRDLAFSHIKLSGFTGNQSDVMYFNFTWEWLQQGFPASLYNDSTTVSGSVAYVSGIPEGRTENVIFALNSRGLLFTLNGSGSGVYRNANEPAARVNPSQRPRLALGDLNDNGQYDVLIAASGDSLTFFECTANSLTAVHISVLPAAIQSGPVFAKGNVAVHCANDSTYVFDVSGLPQLRSGKSPESSAVLLNSSGDVFNLPEEAEQAAVAPIAAGQPALILYRATEQKMAVYALSDTSLLYDWPGSVQPVGAFAFADINGNGQSDIVFNQADGVYGFNANGVSLPGFPLRPRLLTDETLVGSPLILDVDGDGSLDVIAASDQGNIFALNRDGKALPGFPLTTGGTLSETPQVVQLDDDNGLELIAVTNQGSVYAWQLDVEENDPSVVWAQESNSPSKNIYLTASQAYSALSNSLMPAARVFNYPNPNTGYQTKIHYYLNEAATVTIRIFDVSGMPVATFGGPGTGGVDNEISWDVRDVASGIYLCRVEARSAKLSANKIIKIMVVH